MPAPGVAEARRQRDRDGSGTSRGVRCRRPPRALRPGRAWGAASGRSSTARRAAGSAPGGSGDPAPRAADAGTSRNEPPIAVPARRAPGSGPEATRSDSGSAT
jgi:hypothetical protein